MKLYLNSLIVAIVSFFWSASYYIDHPYLIGNHRPYVYRQLVPLLVDGVEFLGVPSPYALFLIMTLSGVGFYLSLRLLALQFYNLDSKQELYLVVGVMVCQIAFYNCYHPYDLMTAWLVTLFFYYFWIDQKAKQLLVFALACLNRETAILLVLFYTVYLFSMLKQKNMRYEIIWMSISQVYLYVLITSALRFVFADYPGVDAYIEPLQNLQQFAYQPYRFLSHIISAVGLLWWMSRGWDRKPEYLRFAFSLFAPLLMVMYLIAGQAFEIRVFWELAPLVIILSLPKP